MKSLMGWILCGATIIVLSIVSAQSGFAQSPNIWAPPPLEQLEKVAAQTQSDVGTVKRKTALVSTVSVISPRPGEAIRGTVEIRATGVDRGGYMIFRIDGNFAYATAEPFEMRWDTTGAEDGNHVIQVSGYNANREFAGSEAITINVKNRIEGGIPPEGMPLYLELREGYSFIKNVEAQSELMGMSSDAVLPAQLAGLDGRLYARFSQSMTSISPIERSADIRTNMRFGVLSSGGKETPLSEKGRFGVANLMPSGLYVPPLETSRRPRIGLGELSLALPIGRIQVGMNWDSPMRVITSLMTRESIQVQGQHTFDGLWWLKGRKCARIDSRFMIGDVPLTSGAEELIAQLPIEYPAQEAELALTASFRGMGGGSRGGSRGGMSGGSRGGSRGAGGGGRSMGGGASRGGSRGGGMAGASRGGARGGMGAASRRGTGTAARTRTQTQATRTATNVSAPKKALVAKLSGLSGTRTTWIDIQQRIVVRTEDHIFGTLVLSEQAGDLMPIALAVPGVNIDDVSLYADATEIGESELMLTGSFRGMGGGSRGGGGGSRGGMSSGSRGGSRGGGGRTMGGGGRSARGGAGAGARGSSRGGARAGGTRTRPGASRNVPLLRRSVQESPVPEEVETGAQRVPYRMTIVVEIAE